LSEYTECVAEPGAEVLTRGVEREIEIGPDVAPVLAYERVRHQGRGRHGALVFVHLAAVPDLHDQYEIRRLDAVDHTVVADAEAAGASKAVAQGLAELEGVGGELGFDGAADLAFGRLGERGDVVGDDGSQVLDAIGQSQASS